MYPPGGELVELDDGRTVHAVVAGSGPDLVILHGASGSTRDWTFAFADRVTDRYRVIVFDRPGMGYTDRASKAYGGLGNTASESPAEQAAMLKAAADVLGVENPIVLGHSYGAAVAMAWALAYDPAALVTVSGATQPWPGGDLPFYYGLAASSLGGRGVAPAVTALVGRPRIQGVTEAIFAPQPVPAGYVDYIGAELTLRRESFLANTRQVNALYPHLVEMQPHYETLDLPVEILHGTADEIVPADIHAAPLETQLPEANLVLLPGIGHMVHHALPEAVEAAIDRAARRAGLR
jgi:pimeloyl-ACP methyl ester carboxylesterase